MREFTKDELNKIINQHRLWINDEGGERADLRNADLRNANLSDADLRNADLRNANLSDANLWNANLSDADLRNADLRNANLSDADLRNANLWNANLSDADLRNANLSDADLRNANLSDADLDKIVIQLPNICKWYLIYNEYNDSKLEIGCKSKTIKEWSKWFKSDDIYDTPRNTNEFKLIKLAFETIKKTIKLRSK